MVTGPNSSPGWLNGNAKATPSGTPSATSTPSSTPSNAPARIGASTQGSVNSSAGSEAIENQSKATPQEELTSQQHLDRLAAAGQLMRKTFDQNKQLEQYHEHLGAIGRAVENADNGLNYHNSYNNVHKRIVDSEANADDLVWQTPEGGDKFNQGYNKVSGFNYDPNHPIIDDKAKWGGEVADNAKSIKGYEKNQKAGQIAFGLFLVPGGYATSGTTANAWEDNTRSDKTHDFTAGDYLKGLGIAAGGIAAGFVPGAGAALNGVTKGITEGAGALASSIGNGAREGAGIASSVYNGFRTGLSEGWQSEMSNWANAGASIRSGFNSGLNSTRASLGNISRPGWLNFGRGGGPAGNVNFTSIRGAGNGNGNSFSNVSNNFRNTVSNLGDSLGNAGNRFKNGVSNVSRPNFSRPSWLTSNGRSQSQFTGGYNARVNSSSPMGRQGARAASNNLSGRGAQAPVSNNIGAQALELAREQHPEMSPSTPETSSASTVPNFSSPFNRGAYTDAPATSTSTVGSSEINLDKINQDIKEIIASLNATQGDQNRASELKKQIEAGLNGFSSIHKQPGSTNMQPPK